MFVGKVFYWELLRKYIITVGTLFNDIHVIRRDSEDAIIKDITVPISYANKRKFFWSLQRKLGDKVSAVLPRMSFYLTGMNYANVRQINPMLKIRSTIDDDVVIKSIRIPTPYDLDFSLTIWTNKIRDMDQIIEQIIPYFTPHYNVTIKEFPLFGIERDVKIVIRGIQTEGDEDLNEEADSIRLVIRSIQFLVHAYFYPPIREETIIRKIINKIKDMDNETYRTIVNEVDPFDAEYSDEWTIKETRVDGDI